MAKRAVPVTDGERNDAIPTVSELQQLIDPEVCAARFEDQCNLGQQWAWKTRQDESAAAAQRVHQFLVARAESVTSISG